MKELSTLIIYGKLPTLIQARKNSKFFANLGFSLPPLAPNSYSGLYSKVLQCGGNFDFPLIFYQSQNSCIISTGKLFSNWLNVKNSIGLAFQQFLAQYSSAVLLLPNVNSLVGCQHQLKHWCVLRPHNETRPSLKLYSNFLNFSM